jgi:elongation factor P hydroxylase
VLLLGNKADVKEVEVDPREVSALAIAAGFVYNFVSAAKNEGISESVRCFQSI